MYRLISRFFPGSNAEFLKLRNLIVRQLAVRHFLSLSAYPHIQCRMFSAVRDFAVLIDI